MSINRRSKFLMGGLAVLLFGAYFIGPQSPKPKLDPKIKLLPDMQPSEVEAVVKKAEAAVPNIKPNNEAEIVWANDSLKEKTEWCVVYLHGFSASKYEGNPTHRDFAKRFGCNLYLARLQAHGVASENELKDLAPEGLVNSAKRAIAIGHQLGKKVLLMSTSTGGTLALYLAANNPDLVDGLICYSPNVDIVDKSSILLTKPWGLQIARLVLGGKYREDKGSTKEVDRYWNKKYRIEALVALRSLMDATMTKKTFEKIKQPTFVGYYYKDKAHQDPTVDVASVLKMYDQLGTSEALKQKVAFPNAGNHVIAGRSFSKDVEGVEKASFEFAEKILKMKPVELTALN
ncbi:alpha/beta hydrolase [Persicobacter psychrovividus]|uniref:Lysophospholipase n=1 Tax=Persicobacter psychrovividus TaxID=387638 RepID=A0ABM7VGZ4_9BACT|nr:lysophospholipase [Persicobacter psychrovividus]